MKFKKMRNAPILKEDSMLQISNLSKTYFKNNKEALKNINLTITKGEFTALLGQNGAGKSTLINILGGNVKKNTWKSVDWKL
jgi:ABC-type multidrug transport system ATPase subunit